jgi:Cu-processing system permease protein
MRRILKYVFLDIVKNKFVVIFSMVLALFSFATFSLEDNTAKGLLTMLNIIQMVVPLVAVLFSTTYIYNSSEFVELLVSQPIKRGKIWWSLFLGLSLSLSMAFIIGVGLALFIFVEWNKALVMLVSGVLLTTIFVAIAFVSAVFTRDKAKGVGLSIFLWLYFALLFDGLLLMLVYQFADYPIEKIMVGVTTLNPIDLSRILILLQLDVSAMMGYTGAVFKNFFGTGTGMVLSLMVLVLWALIPFWISLKKFKNKDL